MEGRIFCFMDNSVWALEPSSKSSDKQRHVWIQIYYHPGLQPNILQLAILSSLDRSENNDGEDKCLYLG